MEDEAVLGRDLGALNAVDSRNRCHPNWCLKMIFTVKTYRPYEYVKCIYKEIGNTYRDKTKNNII